MFSPNEIFNFWFLASLDQGDYAGVLFGGLEQIVQLMETYRDLAIIIGLVLFVAGIFIGLFPGARAFLGDWFK